ncbi:hypothetical protein ILUMI_08669 [Ignelater luminosus]|uniref:Farnesyl pyrophosphate synthase n=1 Tax=Ignelater luminosus TaxID=2038154 RepID=A0A8K0D6H4_IGNLU|nr:hypothetical protein ILUMI_08669 [Ignelater luminosus]
MFPGLVKDLTEPYKNIPQAQNHYIKVLESNVPNHRQATGLVVVTAYKAFEVAKNLTSEHIHLASILGWCVDLLVGSWKMNDDTMDGSDTRCGKPCWYKNDDIGLRAINDAVYLQHCPYLLLKKYFNGHYFYSPALDWFQKMTLILTLGQSMDTDCLENGRPLFDSFTMDRFKTITRYKGSYATLILPIALAVDFAKLHVDLYKQMKSILFEMGNYLDAQNDILD